MRTLYIDESGDHNLTKIDPNYPIFVLGGVLVEDTYHDDVIEPQLDALKRECFGDAEVVLHLYDVKKKRKAFAGLQNPQAWNDFWGRMISLMEGWEYTVIACAIDKTAHVKRYGDQARDPYNFALEIVLERLAMHLRDVQDKATVIAETRRPDLDRELMSVYAELSNQGTGFRGSYIGADEIRERIAGFSLRRKNENLAGLQLADFVLSPIGRHILGKRDANGWRIVRSKFRRDPDTGKHDGWGLVKLP